MKTTKYLSSKSIKSYRENPWREHLAGLSLASKNIRVSTDRYTVVNTTTGEVNANTSMVSRVAVDKEQFIKFFEPAFDSMIFLRRPALDLFLYIMKILIAINTTKCQPDRIYLRYEALRYDHGYAKSHSIFIAGKNELCEAMFIAPIEDENHMFFINILMIFKGNRLSLNKK